MIEWHQLLHKDSVLPIIRKAAANDADAVKACVLAAFDIYTERIGKPPAPMLLDFPAEIEARHVWLAELSGQVVGVLVQYETTTGILYRHRRCRTSSSRDWSW